MDHMIKPTINEKEEECLMDRLSRNVRWKDEMALLGIAILPVFLEIILRV